LFLGPGAAAPPTAPPAGTGAAWEVGGLATGATGLGLVEVLGLEIGALIEVRFSDCVLPDSALEVRPGGGQSRPGGREGGGLVVTGIYSSRCTGFLP